MTNSLRKAARSAALIAILLLSIVPALRAENRWGAQLGVSLTDLHFKQPLVTVKQTPGVTAGIVGEFMFPGIGFGVDLGARYQLLGANVHLGEREMWRYMGYGDTRFYMHSLNIPVHLRFKYTRLGGMEEYIAPLVYVGPSFNFLLGHNKVDAFDFPFGQIGMDFGLGAEIKKRWQLTAAYHLGLTYATSAKVLTNYSAQHRGWQLSLSYFF